MFKKWTLISVFSLLALLLGMADSHTANAAKLAIKKPAAGKVVVKTDSVVEKGRILLRDIAKIEGFSDHDREKIERLYLARAPKPGRTKILSDKFMRKMLLSHAPGGLYTIPEKIYIKRGAKEISEKQIEKMIHDAVCSQTGKDPKKVKISRTNLKGAVLIPSGNTQLRVSFPPRSMFRGLSTAKFEVLAKNQKYSTFFVTADVNLIGNVIRITKDVDKGKIVSRSDFSIEEVSLSNVSRSTITDPQDVIGMKARMGLREGDTLTANMLVAPELIKRGDLVNIVIDNGMLRVETKGVAKQNGKSKQMIKVMNLSSEKIVYGKVVSPEEVHVQF